ncbi:MAG: 16S rRNA (guanine966-N2)-methyltransferase [Pirellulaceae bacterium]|jgi:16S rRNA (guanine966-N2)-methyltransferase
MKDRVREAIFNLLGPDAKDKHAIDLFAGTGALALECISRGAKSATAIERHFPTARLVEQNAGGLGLEKVVDVIASDTFFWLENDFKPEMMPDLPWIVFCSPPYDFYLECCEQLMNMIAGLIDVAPQDSVFIVESDMRFSPTDLPQADRWLTRDYSPARVSILRLSAEPPAETESAEPQPTEGDGNPE